MASLYITNAEGTCFTYELPEDDSAVWALGSGESVTIPLEGESIAPQHATLTRLQSAPTITAVDGAVMVNGEPIDAPTLLVEGVSYSIGSNTLYYGSLPAGESEEEAKGQEPRQRRVAHRSPTARVAMPKENVFVSLITPFYVIGVLAAAFLAGLTLRYWIMTGGYLPDTLFK